MAGLFALTLLFSLWVGAAAAAPEEIFTEGPPQASSSEPGATVTILEVERTKTLIIPTHGQARAILLEPTVVGVRSASESEMVLEGLKIGSSVIHLLDRGGRRTFRIRVVELRAFLEDLERSAESAARRRLGLPERSLKLEYAGKLEHFERSSGAALRALEEQNRVRTHELGMDMALPAGRLDGDLYLEQRRDTTLGKEVAQPRNLVLAWREIPAPLAGETDVILGDRDVDWSEFTLNADRYRGIGLFPSEETRKEPEVPARPLSVSAFTGEERKGYYLDFPAGFQEEAERSALAGTRLEYAVLDSAKLHVTGLTRYGDGSELRADHVYATGLDWNWKDHLRLGVEGARNGPHGGYAFEAELPLGKGGRMTHRYWNVAENYKTVTGPVARDGQTGWEGGLRWDFLPWDRAVSLHSKVTLFRDRTTLNPANPEELNSAYSLGMSALLPWEVAVESLGSYNDSSGLSLPFVSRNLDLHLRQDLSPEKHAGLPDLLWGGGWIQSWTPFLDLRYRKFDKSNNIPGFDAALRLYRIGLRAGLPQGLWGQISLAKAKLKEANPETLPALMHPQELVLEAGGTRSFSKIPMTLSASVRFEDVQQTFSKTHQPFSDRDRLSGDMQFTWQLKNHRELFGNISATRQKPQTQAGATLLDISGLFGLRLLWDTGWAPGQTGALSGSFFQDLNFNGTRDPGEPGIAGARVEVVDGPSTKTNGDGRFHFRSIKEGPRTVKLDPEDLPAGYSFTTPTSIESFILPRKTTTVGFGAATEVSFEGRVFHDLNDNAIFDEAMDSPVPGVWLRLETGQSAQTGGNGYYLIRRVHPGEHTLSAEIGSIPEGYRTLAPTRKTWATQEGERVRFDIPLKALRSISGSIFLDADGDGRRKPPEQGAANVRVRLGQREALTSADGLYRFEEVPPGTYSLGVDLETLPPGYRLRSPDPIQTEVPPGPFTLRGKDFALPPLDLALPDEHRGKPFEVPAPEKTGTREIRGEVQALLQKLAPAPSAFQVIDAVLLPSVPEIAGLAKMHPCVLVDTSPDESATADLVVRMVGRSVYQADYYGSSERALRFRKVARKALIGVRIIPPDPVRSPLLLILSNLSNLPEAEVLQRVDLERLRNHLARLASSEPDFSE